MLTVFLISSLALSLAAEVSTPPNRKPGDWCRGIHMPGQNGGANLMWTTIRGSEKDLISIRQKMEKIGAFVDSLPSEAGLPAIRVSYRDDLDIRSIGLLLNEIDQGKFGQLFTKDMMMPLSTLPEDTCIRR